ncbi:MAG: hypothetical protein ACXW1A_05655 [Nitrososphaeraceae archaeon]
MRTPSYKEKKLFNLISLFKRTWIVRNEEESFLVNNFFNILNNKFTSNEITSITNESLSCFIEKIKSKEIDIETIKNMSYEELCKNFTFEEE